MSMANKSKLWIINFVKLHKRISLLITLAAISTLLNIIVMLAYPSVTPILAPSNYLEDVLPPTFYGMYLISQNAMLVVIFLAGYFYAEHRLNNKKKKLETVSSNEKRTDEDIPSQEDSEEDV